MIKKVTVKYFKEFTEQAFDLSGHVVLVGPNNSGKSTLLQAVMIWNLAMRQWLDKRGTESKAKQRTGVPLKARTWVWAFRGRAGRGSGSVGGDYAAAFCVAASSWGPG